MSPKLGLGAVSAHLITGAALVAGTVLGGSAIASAATFSASPGDNGTVKIHAPETPDLYEKNEPKVCELKVLGKKFDPEQDVAWQIVTHGGQDAGENVLEDTLVLDEDGAGSTDLLDLEDGHYKLEWTFDGQKSADEKHKVFKVVCDDPEPSGDPTDEPTVDPSGDPADGATEPDEEPTDGATDPADPTDPTDPTVDPTDGATDDESVEPTDGATEADDAPAPQESGSDLAVTGSALAGLVTAGAVAIAGGGAAVYLARKRRNAGSEE